jgi:hypothetical protein
MGEKIEGSAPSNLEQYKALYRQEASEFQKYLQEDKTQSLSDEQQSLKNQAVDNYFNVMDKTSNAIGDPGVASLNLKIQADYKNYQTDPNNIHTFEKLNKDLEDAKKV